MTASWLRAAVGGTGIGVVAVAVAGAVGLLGTPAAAHNSLASSAPADRAVLDRAPAAVTLTFLAAVSPRSTTVTLQGPTGEPVAAGPARFDGRSVSLPLRPTVPGAYTAGYRVPSADGHPVTGKITFTLTAKAVPAPAPGASTVEAGPPTGLPTVPSPPPTQSAVPARADADAGAAADAGGRTWWPWLLGAAGLVALGLAGLALRRHRGRLD